MLYIIVRQMTGIENRQGKDSRNGTGYHLSSSCENGQPFISISLSAAA